MFKKTRSLFSHTKHETDVAKYIKEVRDLEAAGVTRRELFKMGLKASATGLVTVTGASLIPSLAQAQNGGAVATNGVTGGGNRSLIISPPCTKPWSEPLVIPKVCQPVSQFSGLPSGEYPNDPSLSIEKFHSGCGLGGDWERYTDARREPHQRWKELNGESSVKYELECLEIDWNFYSADEYPTFNSKVWTYKDMTPNANGDYACGPARIKAYYGQPVLMRMFNSLPMQGRDNQGFGINQISPHLHNAHNPPESDGGPNRFFDSAKFTIIGIPIFAPDLLVRIKNLPAMMPAPNNIMIAPVIGKKLKARCGFMTIAWILPRRMFIKAWPRSIPYIVTI